MYRKSINIVIYSISFRRLLLFVTYVQLNNKKNMFRNIISFVNQNVSSVELPKIQKTI